MIPVREEGEMDPLLSNVFLKSILAEITRITIQKRSFHTYLYSRSSIEPISDESFSSSS